LSVLVNGQFTVMTDITSSILYAEESSVVVFYDDFETRADNTILAGQGLWVQEINSMKTNDNAGDMRVNPINSGVENITYYNETFDGDHYSQIVVDEITQFAWVGAAVRCQNGSGDAYIYSSDGTDCRLSRVINGTRTDLDATGTAFSVTDVVRLEVVGYNLYCYINGSLDTAIDGDGIYDDSASGSKLDGGWAGVEGRGNTSASDLDDWEGGNM